MGNPDESGLPFLSEQRQFLQNLDAIANRSVTAQAVRGSTLPNSLYDYRHPIGGLRRSAPTNKKPQLFTNILPANANHTLNTFELMFCLYIRSFFVDNTGTA
jgi:hypothetical protein